MKHLIICLGIFLSLALSRFIPHPPNFTSLLALSFYVPALLGLNYLPILLISFAITDFVIGYHTGTFFTWGSVFLIGLVANIFPKNILSRMSGALVGAVFFFIVTNFGVWVLDKSYEKNIYGLINCYIAALPFLKNSIISTIFYTYLTFSTYNFSKKLIFKG